VKTCVLYFHIKLPSGVTFTCMWCPYDPPIPFRGIRFFLLLVVLIYDEKNQQKNNISIYMQIKDRYTASPMSSNLY